MHISTVNKQVLHNLEHMIDLNEAIQLAIKHHQAGNLQQAENLYKEILKFQPNNFYALQYLGVLNIRYGNYDSAIEYIEKAIQANPNDSHAHYNLGIAFSGKGQTDKALDCYQKAIQLNPNNVDAYVNLGIIHKEKGAFEDATINFQKALRLNPDHVAAYNNLGIVLKEKGRLDEAIIYYQKGIQLNPYFADIYFNLGTALQGKGRLDEAVTNYQKTLELNPFFVEAYNNLGTALMEQGKRNDALSYFDKALDIKPDFLAAQFNRCIAQIPIIYREESEIDSSRERYYDELIKLRDNIILKTSQDIEIASRVVGTVQPFYLAYQNKNNKELQQIYGSIICQLMSLKYPQYSAQPVMPSLLPNEPLRIGIVSGHFHNHSVWKIPIRGWIENIDKNLFNLYGYYTWPKKDEITVTARRYFTRFVEDIYSFDELCQIIRNDNLHVLIYPEIGMDAVTIRLATLRLAPIQCASWGHPDTSGLPTIDYYLSGDLMELPEANEHYTEHLVRLPNLSIYYTPAEIPIASPDRNTFGLRSQSILYHCCQTLFKFLPQYDEIFPLIARQIRDCQFIFSSYPKSRWLSEQFQLRIKNAFDRFNLKAEDYTIFLPFLDENQYKSLYKLSDILLDPIGWSGCNTAIESLACNLPILTLPGNLMRSREVSAILNIMDLSEIVASSVDNYISIAVKLGKDSDLRQQISEKIAKNKYLIYQDRKCITALEDFLQGVVKEKLG